MNFERRISLKPRLFVIEAVSRGRKWVPTSNVEIDGRRMDKLLKAVREQFPMVKFRKAVYVRDE